WARSWAGSRRRPRAAPTGGACRSLWHRRSPGPTSAITTWPARTERAEAAPGDPARAGTQGAGWARRHEPDPTMLTTRGAQPSITFTRQDFRRAVIAGATLVVALTAIFALDLFPQRLVIQVGDVAASDIVAPRAGSYVSDIKTSAAKDEASKLVDPVYDFSDD